MKTIEIFRKAREYIVQGWCQETIARNAFNEPCEPDDIFANKWCAIGALYAATRKDGHSTITKHHWDECIDALQIQCGTEIGCWNDTVGMDKQDILKVFDEVISNLEKSNA